MLICDMYIQEELKNFSDSKLLSPSNSMNDLELSEGDDSKLVEKVGS
jgi:hypothetical protein